MRAVVLLSGGLDSTVSAAVAKEAGLELCLLTIHYGQRHAVETRCARAVGQWLEAVDHRFLNLDLRGFGGSALTTDVPVPKSRSEEERHSGIPITYVPARNTIFLSLALAYAEVSRASAIYIGANIRDYSGYPDCRPEFLQAFQETARLGTQAGIEGYGVAVQAPLLFMSKAEIIQKGLALAVPFHLTHSCYDPGPEGVACGQCDSCVIRLEGFREAGIEDPVGYMDGGKVGKGKG